MSCSNAPQNWESRKNAIHTLYILEGRPLQGKGGVREEMRRRYNFWGGKNQYERYFEEWGFRKKQTKESWQIASLKVGKRKRDGKDSNVYLDGLLLPRKKLHKEMSRQGFMTMKEQLLWAQAPSPSTPAGFQIRTPSANSVSRLVFEELPILQFQGTIQNFAESIPSLDRSSSALVPFIKKILNNNATNSTPSMLESFLPTFAFKDESLGSGLAIEKIDQMGSTQALSLIVYMISNNLSAESKANEIYRWLKKHGLINPATFRTMKGPSADALLENLFQLAVEAEDLQMVKNLISMGANPNASRCKHKGCPIAFTPLQYACLRGNILLVEELIRAGSHIDDAKSEWRDSALILAIFGYGERIHLNDLAGIEGNDMYEDGEEDNEPDLLNLVQILVQSQVSVNFDGHNHHNEATSVDEWIRDLRPEGTFYPLIAENHSPLTMASKYLYMLVVDFLLLNGADVSYCLDGLHSALRECLYPSEYMECEESEPDQYSWLGCHEIYRRNFAPGVKQSSRIHYIVRSLVEAGVELNDHLPCDDDDDDHSCHWRSTDGNSGCYSALDLAMTTNNAQLANILISAGANTTKHSLDLAIATKNAELIDIMISTGASTTEHTLDLAMGLAVFDTFRRLLDSATNPPKWATAPGDNLLISYASPWTRIRHTGILDLHRERALILAAVRLGETSYLKGLVESPKNELTGILDYCLGLPAALEHCCSRGFVETFRFLLRSNFMDRTPLASVLGYSLPIAIENGHDELTDVLLEAGADVNTTLEGKPPIFLAIRRRNLPLVRKLIQAGSRLEYRTPPCHYGGLGNVLISAIDSGYDAVIEEVLRAGADINGLGRAGLGLFSERECFSPLTMAIKRGRWALVDRLRRAQAWVNASCSHLGLGSCRTSLWAATVGKNSQLVRLLLEDGAEVNDLRAVEAAVDDYELLQVFVERLIARAGRGEKFHALRLALGRALGKPRQIESVRLILQSGLVDVNALFEDQTPLAIALRSRHIEEKHEILQLLLNSGANPSSVVCIPSRGDEDRGRQTALMIAIDAKDLGSVNMLLRFGADVNKPAEPGMLYSHAQYAARWGTEDILRALLDRDSDPNSVSPWGQKGNYTRVKIGTAIQEATERNSLEMVQMLLEHKASPDTVTQCSPHTGLQIACRHGNKAIVELLLEYGANVNAPPAERYGATALQFAAIGGYLGIAFLLLAKGANVNAPPAKFEGRSALEGAAEHGRIDMVQLLKNTGADISEVGQEHYERALARALEKGHYATRRLLLSYLS